MSPSKPKPINLTEQEICCATMREAACDELKGYNESWISVIFGRNRGFVLRSRDFALIDISHCPWCGKQLHRKDQI